MFGFVNRKKVPLNRFNMHPEKTLTCNMGKLIPILCEDVLPGDIWRLNLKMLVRLQALIAPIYHRVDIFTYFFFVPLRLVWRNSQEFLTGYNEETGEVSTAQLPSIKSPAETGWKESSLFDYLGLPTGVPNFTSTSGALYTRAYVKVINDWFRNQWLTDSYSLSLDDGLDTTTYTDLVSRCWEQDIFTQALPSTQRGPVISIPLGTEAPVVGNGNIINLTAFDSPGLALRTSSYDQHSGILALENSGKSGAVKGSVATTITSSNTSNVGLTQDPKFSGMVADLSQAADVTIPDLRKSVQLQNFAEISARVGVRYTEFLQGHFGVRSSDARLQRPEFLGGGVAPLDVSAVVQTSQTTTGDEGSAQGTLSGLGLGAMKTASFRRRFTEHGIILGLMCIMPRTSYQQGSRKMFNRETMYDFAIPTLSHLSEQPVYEQELFAQSDGASTTVGDIAVSNKTIFGFNPQYEEYRYIPSMSHGAFKSSLNYYTMNRVFDAPPLLNSDFVQADPTKRIFAVTEQETDSCLVNILYNIKAYRPLPKHGTPGWMDHPF